MVISRNLTFGVPHSRGADRSQRSERRPGGQKQAAEFSKAASCCACRRSPNFQKARGLKLFRFAGSRPGVRLAGPILGWTTGVVRGKVGGVKRQDRLCQSQQIIFSRLSNL